MHIPHVSLPRRLGGLLDHDHREWLARCLKISWSRSSLAATVVVGTTADLDERIETYLGPAQPHNHRNQRFDSLSSSMSTAVSIDDGATFGDWDGDGLPATKLRRHAHHDTFDTDSFNLDDLSTSLEWNDPFLSSWSPTTKQAKRSIDLTPPTPYVVDSPIPESATIELPGKRRQPSCGDDSIHEPEPGGFTIRELVDYCRIKGQKGLMKDYALIKVEPPMGTFEVSR